MTKQLLKKLGVGFVALAAYVGYSAPAEAACFIFVHGHRDSNQTWQQARDYWKYSSWIYGNTDMVADVSANNKFAVINYNPLVPYWDAAKEVAGKMNTVLNGGNDGGGKNCVGETSFTVVAHSMGNAVMDFILGNSRSTDPYYNYGGANFYNIGLKVTRMAGVQGAHRGTPAADATCGNYSWFCNAVAYFVASCDPGTVSLQTATSQQVYTYANGPKATVFLVGSYEAMASSSCLNGEDDGVIPYPSSFACSSSISATASHSTTTVCSNSMKQETSGFKNADQSHEDHSDGRDGNDKDDRLAVADGIWGAYSTGTKLKDSMSTAEMIRCAWAYRPAGDTACNY